MKHGAVSVVLMLCVGLSAASPKNGRNKEPDAQPDTETVEDTEPDKDIIPGAEFPGAEVPQTSKGLVRSAGTESEFGNTPEDKIIGKAIWAQWQMAAEGNLQRLAVPSSRSRASFELKTPWYNTLAWKEGPKGDDEARKAHNKEMWAKLNQARDNLMRYPSDLGMLGSEPQLTAHFRTNLGTLKTLFDVNPDWLFQTSTGVLPHLSSALTMGKCLGEMARSKYKVESPEHGFWILAALRIQKMLMERKFGAGSGGADEMKMEISPSVGDLWISYERQLFDRYYDSLENIQKEELEMVAYKLKAMSHRSLGQEHDLETANTVLAYMSKNDKKRVKPEDREMIHGLMSPSEFLIKAVRKCYSEANPSSGSILSFFAFGKKSSSHAEASVEDWEEVTTQLLAPKLENKYSIYQGNGLKIQDQVIELKFTNAYNTMQYLKNFAPDLDESASQWIHAAFYDDLNTNKALGIKEEVPVYMPFEHMRNLFGISLKPKPKEPQEAKPQKWAFDERDPKWKARQLAVQRNQMIDDIKDPAEKAKQLEAEREQFIDDNTPGPNK